MLKCIGSKCHFHFCSDIYYHCDLAEKYVTPSYECKGIKHINKRKQKLQSEIKLRQKELDILKHLQNHIKKNQYLIGE